MSQSKLQEIVEGAFMNIREAKEEIKNTIKAYLMRNEDGEYAIDYIRQRPLLLIGPPGVGKTQIMEQISRECRIGLVAYTITHHTRQSAIGLPYIERKEYGGKEMAVTEYTMSEIVASVYDYMEETGVREGILFIDEINCVSETLAPTMLQFLQGKTFGNHRIPEGWIIVAAGNPAEYNKSVREFDIVTLDRIRKIDVVPDLEAWKKYAFEAGIHPAVVTYLGIKEKNFCRIETTVDGKFFVTPRGWEDLSKLIYVYEKLGLPVGRETIGEYLQFPETAKDFANYYELYNKYQSAYRVDEILSGRIDESLCDRFEKAPFDEKYSVTGLIVSRLSSDAVRLSDMAAYMTKLKERLTILKTELYKNAILKTELYEGDLAKADDYAEGSVDSRVRKEGGSSINDRINSYIKEFSDKLSKDAAARIITKKEYRLRENIADFLRRISVMIAEQGVTDETKAWGIISGEYNKAADEYEDSFDELGLKLEHAFDFMEAVFGAGQEMVMFMTALNSNPAIPEFLKDYDCERYFQYNKELLFDDREDRIKERISEMI